jgi:hypothetical protein
MAEETPGANLTKEEALASCAVFLRENKNVDLTSWKLVDASSNKLPARTDHTFTWEKTAPLTPVAAGEEGAHERMQLQVLGAEVSGYRVFVHIPEAWLRQHQQTNLGGTVQNLLLAAAIGALAISVLVVFFRNLRHGMTTTVPWRRLGGWSLAALAGTVITYLTTLPEYLASYSTQDPFKTFVGTRFIGLALGATLFYSLCIFLFGLAWFFLAKSYGAETMPGWRGMPASYYRDGLLVGIAGTLSVFAFGRLTELLSRAWAVRQYASVAAPAQELDFLLPALHALGNGTVRSLIAVGLLALAIGFSSYCSRSYAMQTLALAILALLTAPTAGSAGEFVQRAAVTFTGLALLWWASKRIVRFNLLGYFLVAILSSLLPAAVELLRQPNAFFQANGWFLFAAMAGFLLWPLALWQKLKGIKADVPGIA